MQEQAGASLNLLTQQGGFSTATSKTDTQGRGWREGRVESKDLIWVRSPNPGLPSLSLFPWIHGEMVPNGGSRKSSVQALSTKQTTLTGLGNKMGSTASPDCLVVDWLVLWEELQCATPGEVYKGTFKSREQMWDLADGSILVLYHGNLL